MTVTVFIAAQRTEHGIPHAVSCRALGRSQSWFYKWWARGPSPRAARRARLAEAVAEAFHRRKGTEGSPRITVRLRRAGWRVGENMVAGLMREQHLTARPRRRRRGTTRSGKGRWCAPDLLGRDFTAPAPNVRWCGDGTEIPTGEGKLYLDTVEDLFSRRVAGFAMGAHHDEALAQAALRMAVAVRGGNVTGVVFHTDYAEPCVKPRDRGMPVVVGLR